jgi:hypothetical protein
MQKWYKYDTGGDDDLFFRGPEKKSHSGPDVVRGP